jgi:hypothetical protein
MTMDWLWYALDRVAPTLHTWVGLLGRIPAGVLSIALLVALWYIARKLAFFVIVLPGVIAGWAIGAWLYFAHGWHPLLCIGAGLAISAAIFQILANFLYIRLLIAVVLWPLAVVAIWHLAAGALDTLWALALTAIGATTTAALLRRFVNTENHDLYVWARDLIDDLRGD